MDTGLGTGDDFLGEGLVVGVKEPLKGVGISPVANVVEESSYQSQEAVFCFPKVWVNGVKALYHTVGDVINPQAMGESAVLATMEGVAGRSQLLDATEPLELGGVDQLIDNRIGYTNIVVNRVTKNFLSHVAIIAKKACKAQYDGGLEDSFPRLSKSLKCDRIEGLNF